ncbi:unnamed protein product [Mycena citricolor]|uniref:Endonuclease/exonuclease/phosphatase domain-containing protein n=1 Tax=Mycena citricolor TaxID=2018698 RepID=A0AAD2H2Q4_9AGAR|nr:unnamed protein product [Mycena citricolor]
MVLPKDIPTLKSHSTGNYTQVDNVFCSEHMVDDFVTCGTSPSMRPTKTDHMPILFSFHCNIGNKLFTPKPNWRATNWQEFRKTLESELNLRPRHNINDATDIEEEIRKVDEAIAAAIQKHVPMTKPSPHSKRWWNPGLSTLRAQLRKAQNYSYAH